MKRGGGKSVGSGFEHSVAGKRPLIPGVRSIFYVFAFFFCLAFIRFSRDRGRPTNIPFSFFLFIDNKQAYIYIYLNSQT